MDGTLGDAVFSIDRLFEVCREAGKRGKEALQRMKFTRGRRRAASSAWKDRRCRKESLLIRYLDIDEQPYSDKQPDR